MSQVITGYLPIQILQVFLSFVPPIMIMLSSLQGHISWSQIQKSACSKVLWFTIWNIFFANVLSGSALYRLNYFLEPKEFPRVLAEAVPVQVRIFAKGLQISLIFAKGFTILRGREYIFSFCWCYEENDTCCYFLIYICGQLVIHVLFLVWFIDIV